MVGVDTHIVMIPSPGGPVPTPMQMPFNATLDGGLSNDVKIENKPAAVKGSTATNTPHVASGGPFQKPPADKGTVETGSASVLINNKPAAQMGATVMTCNDPADAPNGTVIVTTVAVLIGD